MRNALLVDLLYDVYDLVKEEPSCIFPLSAHCRAEVEEISLDIFHDNVVQAANHGGVCEGHGSVATRLV